MTTFGDVMSKIEFEETTRRQDEAQQTKERALEQRQQVHEQWLPAYAAINEAQPLLAALVKDEVFKSWLKRKSTVANNHCVRIAFLRGSKVPVGLTIDPSFELRLRPFTAGNPKMPYVIDSSFEGAVGSPQDMPALLNDLRALVNLLAQPELFYRKLIEQNGK